MKKRRRKRRDNKIWNLFRFFVEVLLLMALAAILFLTYKYYRMEIDKIDDRNTKISSKLTKEEIRKMDAAYDVFPVMFEEEEDQLADILVLIGINKEKGAVRFASLDTDLLLFSDWGARSSKQIYRENGPQEVMSVLNQNLDLNMKDYCVIKGKVVIRLADLLGGVDVNLSEGEAEELNRVLAAAGKDKVPGPGKQHLNGEQAYLYCSSHTEGSNVNMMDKVAEVAGQLWYKAVGRYASSINDTSNAFLYNVRTTLDTQKFVKLVAATIFRYYLDDYVVLSQEKGSLSEQVRKGLLK